MINKHSRLVIVCFVFLPILSSCFTLKNDKNTVESSEKSKEQIRCKFYNSTCIREAKENGIDDSKCHGTQQCPDKFCYAVWKNQTVPKNQTNLPHESAKHDIRMMGCLGVGKEHSCSVDGDACLDKKNSQAEHGHYFCCCKGDLCNENFKAAPPKAEPIKPLKPVEPKKESDNMTAVVICIAVVLVFVIGAVSFFIGYKMRKTEDNPPIDQTQALLSHSMHQSSSGMTQEQPDNVPSVQLVIVIGKGKYGNVWKAKQTLNSKEIAVKTFSLASKKSWEDEKHIYKLPHMDSHPNVLKFLFATQKYDNLNTEFWLATELQVGCLHTHLKENTVSWDQMCNIALTMVDGLTFLHEECPPKGSVKEQKPSIAHRDFKSKNVLIKNDMTACIADFGLAMELEDIGDTHGQVGTIRYMAPEVLEGAINFSRDAFLRIDMYACALVLWELASRCKMTDNFQVFDYKLPFEAEEEEQNKMPNALNTMQDLVVTQKVKPKIQDSWRSQQKTKILCDTIEECWDQDAEARLSASCVGERVRQFRNLNSSHPAQHQIISGNYGNGGNIIDSGVSVSGGSDNSDETDNINSSDEIPMSELSSNHPFGQT